MRENTQKYVVLLIFLIFIIILGYKSLSYYENKHAQDPEKERERVMSYCIQCYASEGMYPPDLKYLEENYGFRLKEESYEYFYDVFSSNVRPDIVVTAKLDKNENADKLTEALYGE